MRGGRSRPIVAAAVDIGAYSVHLLVAGVRGHRLDELVDQSAFLSLGQAVDRTGELSSVRGELLQTLENYLAIARAEGAQALTVVGTDPLRRAADADETLAEIRATLGVDAVVLRHDEEAQIALIGVQAGRPVLRETVMVDIGGGSTEVLIAGPTREPVAVGLPLGATRLTGTYVANEPPTPNEVASLIHRTRASMAAAPDASPAQVVAVGGTARSLLRVGPRLANRALSRRRIRRTLDLLTTMPAEDLSQRYAVRLSRVRVLAAGGAILLGALDRYGIDRVRVAKGGLREGLILAAHRAGLDWRSKIGDLARGWER
jgi:exopolyphosphatase/guanosine-5'-triphosphate,3'-diphosphate pyrophosphatase